MDSTPVIFLSGQVSRANSKTGLDVRQRGIQEVDMIPIVKPITKYAELVQDPTSIRYHLEKALFFARHGRPGPVWLDIPLDVQGAMVDESLLKGFEPGELGNELNPRPQNKELEFFFERLANAKRPLLILGGGIPLSGARELVPALVEHLKIPVQTTWNGMDLLPENHELFFGRANTFGPRYANIIVQNADLLIAIGARFGMQHTGYNVKAFGRGAFKVMVDLDPAELSKLDLKIDLPLKVDALFFIEEVLKRPIKKSDMNSWLELCQKTKDRFPFFPSEESVQSETYVNPYFFTHCFSEALPANSVIPIGSSGMGHTVVTGIFEVKKGQRVFTSKGLAAMGYGLPSTIGACFASEKKLTATVIGDGGLQLNIQELQTIRHHKLPIKLFIWNNQGYHSIRMTQKNYFKGHYVGSTPDSGVSLPDLSELAKTYRFNYSKISNNENLKAAIQKVLELDGPTICEVMIDPERALEPKLASYQTPDGRMESRPIEDMSPLLDREELQKYLTIPLIS
jgi:acetolactate synthase-1/2/3 large subunit